MFNLATRVLTTIFLLAITISLISGNQNRASNSRKITISQEPELGSLAFPYDIKFIGDVVYREGNKGAWKLDLAMPKAKSDQKLPAIVFVHDGVWRYGDKRNGYSHKGLIDFARKGYVCISVNFRLIDEAPFPACVEDVKCAVRWLRAHAEKYNVDTNRIGGFGSSSGAHIISMLGLDNDDANLEENAPWSDHSSRLNAVAAAATPTDLPNWSGGYDNNQILLLLLKSSGSTREEQAHKASPINYVHQQVPPILLFHGTEDQVVEVSQTDRFVEALKSVGASDVTYHRYEGAGHSVFKEHRKQTYAQLEDFFERTLLNPELNSKQ